MKQKTKKKKFEQSAKAPTESPGSYYVRKGRNNNWYLMIETDVGGERKQRGVEQARFNDRCLVKTMTQEQARTRVSEINRLDRNKKSEYRAKIFSAKRAEWQKAVDRIYCPPGISPFQVC